MKKGIMAQIKSVELKESGYVQWYKELVRDNAVGTIEWISSGGTFVGFRTKHPSVPNPEEDINLSINELCILGLYKEV